MPSSSAEWDERYRQGRHASAGPDSFLEASRAYWELLRPQGPPKALDVACGAGRNALYLAREGFRVTAVDYSSEALAIARSRAAAAGLALQLAECDLEARGAALGESEYHLIAVFQFLHRPLFPAIRQALRPGGLIVYRTYTLDQVRFGGPKNPDFLLAPNELLERFAGFRVLRYQEEWDGEGAAGLIAQKP